MDDTRTLVVRAHAPGQTPDRCAQPRPVARRAHEADRIVGVFEVGVNARRRDLRAEVHDEPGDPVGREAHGGIACKDMRLVRGKLTDPAAVTGGDRAPAAFGPMRAGTLPIEGIVIGERGRPRGLIGRRPARQRRDLAGHQRHRPPPGAPRPAATSSAMKREAPRGLSPA